MVTQIDFGNRKQVTLRRGMNCVSCGIEDALAVAIDIANTDGAPVEILDVDGTILGIIHPDPTPDDRKHGDETPYDDGMTVDTDTGRGIVASIADPNVHLRFPAKYLASTARPIAQRVADQTGRDIEMVEIDTGKVLQTFRRRGRK
jgi:hypothetical protein